MPKTHVNLAVDHDLWVKFKAACDARKIVASKLFEDLMREQMERWQEEG